MIRREIGFPEIAFYGATSGSPGPEFTHRR